MLLTIRDWDKTVKYAADARLLANTTVLLLTRSDLVLIQEARMRFPGRRGTATQVDFYLYPLTFRETVILKGFDLQKIMPDKKIDNDLDKIYILFNDYLKHGGYLTAINDWAITKSIAPTTLRTYIDVMRRWRNTCLDGLNEYLLNFFTICLNVHICLLGVNYAYVAPKEQISIACGDRATT